MEGRVCSVERCNCVDFLPFECSLCGNVFCLEHRSRFAHSCPELKASQHTVPIVSGPSVREMMDAVEHRFDPVQSGSHKEHFHIKSSTGAPPSDEKFAKKLHTLDRIAESSSSSKQRKISLKAREMLIKSKASGNASISGADRFFVCVHFAGSMQEAEADPHHHIEYLFFSSTKTLGEAMQHIWNKFDNTISQTAGFKADPALRGLSRDDVCAVMSTNDSPNWHDWDRMWQLNECLANYEDIAVFAAPVNDVIMNQDALMAAREHAAMLAMQPPVSTNTEEDVSQEPAEYQKHSFIKGDLAWYHKIPADVGAKLSVGEMEKAHPMVKVKITGVHHDDFPNVYYSVQMKTPVEITSAEGSSDLSFTHEKQTDHTHLVPMSVGSSGASSAPRSKAGDAAADRAAHAAAAHMAALELQNTLCTMGTPVPIKVSFSNKDYNMSIGTLCSVSQLKLLIGAITDVPVPEMKLIVKGTVLKSNTQLIKDTKIVKNSKIIVMSSGVHIV